MSSDDRFEFADRVRHTRRPEWGVGTVIKAEVERIDGEAAQRLSIRFANAGLKTLHTTGATLVRAEDDGPTVPETEQAPLAALDELEQSEWLGPVAHRKVEQAMVSLPSQATDPFIALRDRLSFTVALYRFDRSGRGLMDWAVAQTGLDDPLTRFTRHELEEHFDRWVSFRDEQLARLLTDPSCGRALVEATLDAGPPSARDAVRRLTVSR